MGDKSGNYGAGDKNADQNKILNLIDDTGLQFKQAGYCAERQACDHQQRRVHDTAIITIY
jgi:hypothetical protein